MKTYGKAELVGDEWKISAEPHVMMRLKRVVEGINKASLGTVVLSHTPEHCRELEWFCERFPLEVIPATALEKSAAIYKNRIQKVNDLISGKAKIPPFSLAIQPRKYQAEAAALARASKSLLIADDLGLGKSAEAIAAFAAPDHLPTLVVCQAHLCRQWTEEVAKFAPKLHVHTLKTNQPYRLPEFFGDGPDVIVTSYHKLFGWSDLLSRYCRSAIFDEAQELRRPESKKYQAARLIAEKCGLRIGLSATPIHNYGAEIYYLLNVIAPGRLGSFSEFVREWCGVSWISDKAALQDPKAFSSYLRQEGLMIRRTREDVGRELPAVSSVVHIVDSDSSALDAIQDTAAELAKIILNQKTSLKGEAMQAAGELDWRLRQATGIAKAVQVVSFVKMLVENGEPVVLVGWHRAVYEIWKAQLESSGIKWATYTGSESTAEKDSAKERFMSGAADVLILSLRSGTGLNGLQERGSTIVFGELDWSPAIHNQCIGRLNRDGQKRPVVAYYLVSEEGSDPVVGDVLGIKKQQLEGILNPKANFIEKLESDPERIKKLAERFLERRTNAIGIAS